MKKFLLVITFLVITCTPLFSFFNPNFSYRNIATENSYGIVMEDDWVEYIIIDGQWYKITHYSDGAIDVVPVAHPPDD